MECGGTFNQSQTQGMCSRHWWLHCYYWWNNAGSGKTQALMASWNWNKVTRLLLKPFLNKTGNLEMRYWQDPNTVLNKKCSKYTIAKYPNIAYYLLYRLDSYTSRYCKGAWMTKPKFKLRDYDKCNAYIQSVYFEYHVIW